MSEERPYPRLEAPLLISTSQSLHLSAPLSPSAAADWDADDATYVEQEAAARVEVDVPYEPRSGFSLSLLWKYAGPGWLMSLAYLDPGNIEADLQAGAYAGYSLLWLLLLCHVIGLVVQILAARLGVVTGFNLAELCRLEFQGYRRWVLWLMIEVAIIGSDIQEVVGSAIAFQLLFGWPLWVGCIVTACDSFTFLAFHFLGVRAFERFVGLLIFTMAVSFSVDCLLAQPQPGQVLAGFVPWVRSSAVLQAVGTLGSVIMPHNLYLHSALVQSRRVDHTSEAHVKQANLYLSVEAAGSLALSFFINAAVVCCFASGFWAERCAALSLACVPLDEAGGAAAAGGEALIPCESGGGAGVCATVGLSVAGQTLHRLLPGSSARFVWAIGLLAAGQASTMTGTLAGQYVMEGFLSLRLAKWKRTLLTRSLALGPAVAVALMCQADPVAGDRVDEWLNVMQSIQLPFAVLPLVVLTNDERIMGHFRNRGPFRLALWALVLTILAVNALLVAIFFFAREGSGRGRGPWTNALVLAVGAAYVGFLSQLLFRPAPGKRPLTHRLPSGEVEGSLGVLSPLHAAPFASGGGTARNAGLSSNDSRWSSSIQSAEHLNGAAE